jgi:hypothetical protein
MRLEPWKGRWRLERKRIHNEDVTGHGDETSSKLYFRRVGKGGGMSVDDDSLSVTHLVVGEQVILRDSQHGTIEQVTLESGEPRYTVRMPDGSQRVVQPDDLIRAKTNAKLAAPGTDWTGEERRKDERRVKERRTGQRRTSKRPTLGRRKDKRREGDRRRH